MRPLIITFLVVCLYISILSKPSPTYAQETTAEIRVCHILIDANISDTTILDGSIDPTATFQFSWFDPRPPELAFAKWVAPTVPPSYTFRNSSPLNTKVQGFPNGPGNNGNNAQCTTYNNLPLPYREDREGNAAHYYYRELSRSAPARWPSVQYHDSYIGTPSLNNLDNYNNVLYNGNPDDDDDSARNTNSDGNICLGACTSTNFRQERDLIIVSRYYTLASSSTPTPRPSGPQPSSTPTPSATGGPTAPPTPTPTPTPALNFFTIERGNVYSQGSDISRKSIINPLPTSHQFIPDNVGILFSKFSNTFGRSTNSVAEFVDENYNYTPSFSYDTLFQMHQNKIQRTNLQGNNNIASGIYLHENGVNRDLRINSGSNFSNMPSGNKIIIFIEGNLYIDNNQNNQIVVPADGKTLLTFIVKGNIGIHPSIQRLDGVYIAGNALPDEFGNLNGFIDTACNTPSERFTAGQCTPSSTNTNSTLRINGLVYAKNGFHLDRTNASGSPSEIFSLRPDFYLSSSELMSTPLVTWREVTE